VVSGRPKYGGSPPAEKASKGLRPGEQSCHCSLRLTPTPGFFERVVSELTPDGIVATVIAGLVALSLVVVESLSYAALIFSGPLSSYIDVGISRPRSWLAFAAWPSRRPLLDGGFDKWLSEGLPVEHGPAKGYPPAVFAAKSRPGRFVDEQRVFAAGGDPDFLIVNALGMAGWSRS
jgi:hypothetical protein